MKMNTVLIANRGEIAVRIIRACQKLGLRSVAVFSDADRGAPFVSMADTAIHIGASEARHSYLNPDVILKAAKQAGANAVHPGYGFLSENAEFAESCEKASLIFVGPSPTLIAQMGSKIAAKAIAEQAGVPVVPGYFGEDQSDDRLLTEADKIGLPLLIKASAGGGGRGMRRVYDLADFADELFSARQEAQLAFGDPAVLLERFVENGRHVEVQILADKHGNTLHLFDRDCSIQRNHQKVVEEAPAPNLPDQVRQVMLNSAVNLVKNIGYDSVGTVEYIYDPKTEEFFFLEMNTRLQVEHPVTEQITNIDLVEWQLRVAAGEKIPFHQEDIKCQGWAMEVRVAAEDASDNFRAQVGNVRAYEEPVNMNIRVDSGIDVGSVICHHYDSMLAKIIATGRDRESAIRTLKHALDHFLIAGIGTNTGFLADVISMELFNSGEHHTGLLTTNWPDGWQRPPLSQREKAEAVLALHLSRIASQGSPWSSLGGWRITYRAGRPGSTTWYLREKGEDLINVRIEGTSDSFSVFVDDVLILQSTQSVLDGNYLCYEADGQLRSIRIEIIGSAVTLQTSRGSRSAEILTAEQCLLVKNNRVEEDSNHLISPMPGMVSSVFVKASDKVEKGQPIIVIEAMKMLQELVAPITGTIKSLRIQEGDPIDGGAVLVVLEPFE